MPLPPVPDAAPDGRERGESSVRLHPHLNLESPDVARHPAPRSGPGRARSGRAGHGSGRAGPRFGRGPVRSGDGRSRFGSGRPPLRPRPTAIAIVGGTILAAIGFTGSYNTLRDLAFDRGFGDFSYVFPVGIDAGIVVLYALDLYLIRRHTPWPIVRMVAHLLTVATVVFNAAAAEGGVRRPAGHGHARRDPAPVHRRRGGRPPGVRQGV
ncbi:DUF2637 domain-containing protein [Streptomyces sp. SHP22-7]|nr:DUF2637 domain-containing protein [Streptomyces sp. SHP22-7]